MFCQISDVTKTIVLFIENFMRYNEVYGLEVPTMQAVWYYIFYITPSKFLYSFICLFLHWIPAYIIDALAVVIGKKPM